MLIAFMPKVEIQKLKSLLTSRFEKKDLGVAGRILDMDIKQDCEKKLFQCQ